jgi:hypothetical protein
MINGKLQEFVRNVAAKGQMSYGDVRRLQRDYLPGGVAKREELELLISLSTRLVRADKAWAQWLVASVVEFVAKEDVREHPSKEAVGKWVGCLLATLTTSVGRRIARRVRCELARQHSIQSTESVQCPPDGIGTCNVRQPSQAGTPETDLDAFSLRMATLARRAREEGPSRSRPLRRALRRRMNQGATALVGAAHGLFLADYLPAVQHDHLINFHSARVALVLAPCGSSRSTYPWLVHIEPGSRLHLLWAPQH